MRKKSGKTKSITLNDILDSDDELPTEYIDLPFVPAYQLDNRFENIEEKKVDKDVTELRKEQTERHIRSGLSNGEHIDLPFIPVYQVDNRFENIEEKKADKNVNKLRKEQTERHTRGRLSNYGTVVASGYLNKKDRFCLQCLEPNTGKKTQQWFLNFLMKKDLHASYIFLTSCLVPSYDNDHSSVEIPNPSTNVMRKYGHL